MRCFENRVCISLSESDIQRLSFFRVIGQAILRIPCSHDNNGHEFRGSLDLCACVDIFL